MNNESCFEKTLVLSTGHIPKSEPDFGELRATAHEYGWIVWLSDAVTKPDWILAAAEYANKNACSMIVYDRDASKVAHLQLWDW